MKFAARIKRNHLLRALSVGRRTWTTVDEGKKGLKSSRDIKARRERWWGGGRREGSLLCDPGSELRLLRGTIVNRT